MENKDNTNDPDEVEETEETDENTNDKTKLVKDQNKFVRPPPGKTAACILQQILMLSAWVSKILMFYVYLYIPILSVSLCVSVLYW